MERAIIANAQIHSNFQTCAFKIQSVIAQQAIISDVISTSDGLACIAVNNGVILPQTFGR